MTNNYIRVVENELEKSKFKLKALQFNLNMCPAQRQIVADKLTKEIRQMERNLSALCR